MKTTRRVFAATLALAGLSLAPTQVQAGETCLELQLGGGNAVEIPCPEGTRPLLEKLPRLAEPTPRRDIAIDPQWPHDQAMVAERDWPYDNAMIVPHPDAAGDAKPLLGDLLDLLDPDSRESERPEEFFGVEQDGGKATEPTE